MLVQFLSPSPNAGTQKHLSRESAEGLIAAGIAREVPKEDPLNRSRCNAHPQAGHRIVRGGRYGEKVFIRYDDGFGGYQLFDQPPVPQRVWVFDPEKDTEEGHYELRQVVHVPPEVLVEFERLGGSPANPFADDDKGIIARERREKAKYEAEKQGKLANTFLAKVGARL